MLGATCRVALLALLAAIPCLSEAQRKQAHTSPQDLESLEWAADMGDIEELALWTEADPPQEIDVRQPSRWMRWAADQPHLRQVKVCDRDCIIIADGDVLCEAVRAEGEDVDAMLQRLLRDLVEACS